MELDFEIGIPCVVQWSMLWFPAPTRLNLTVGRQGLKIKKVLCGCQHGDYGCKFVTIWREHTPRSCMLASVANVPHETQKMGINKEMEGWMMEGSLELQPLADDVDSDEHCDE